MTEWQPIKEAPKDGTKILMAFYVRLWHEIDIDLVVWKDDKWDGIEPIDDRYSVPLYWQPLPNLPENAILEASSRLPDIYPLEELDKALYSNYVKRVCEGVDGEQNLQKGAWLSIWEHEPPREEMILFNVGVEVHPGCLIGTEKLRKCTFVCDNDGCSYECDKTVSRENRVTHWMPLPALPDLPEIKHLCYSGSLRLEVCREEDGYFYLCTSSRKINVKFCPFCGVKAPRFQDEN